ncbi:OmpW/AlkL family protein [Rhizosphaericola mali]|uniref:OmpW family protein n=1 Tax=Rhizosphaericola mali TaxID=2545455 RepID=A0A5P2G7Z7_9BACT|nr:OmpW family outer membrane protein [Rhizosphaericola mali]QES89333.1 OmpW family protein [Rhizosphaericola mali]
MKKIIFSIAITIFSLHAMAQQKGEWRARLRATYVQPEASATISTIGGSAKISHTIIPELDFTYFFVDRFSANLILGTTRNKVTATGTALGDVNLGKVWLLPPTLTVLYHQPLGHGILPYAGAGLNYTIFYGKRNGEYIDNITYKNRLGFATQIGSDFDISKKWFLNIDAKKIWLKTKNDVTTIPSVAGGATVQSDTKINPWLFSVGIGMKF